MSKSRRQQPIFHGWGAVVLSALLLSPTIAARTFLSALLREVAPSATSFTGSGQNRASAAPTAEAAQTPRRAEDEEHALVFASDDDRRDPRLDLDPDAHTASRAPRPAETAGARRGQAAVLFLLAQAVVAAALVPAPPAFVYDPGDFAARVPVHVHSERETAPARSSPALAALPPRAPPLVFAS